MRRIFITIFAFILFGDLIAQLPPVINYRHIVVSGKTLINIGDIETYTADFFYPNETGRRDWVVYNGVILAENTDPNLGPIFVTVRWTGGIHLPDLPPSLGIPTDVFGVVIMKQNEMGNGSIYQAGAIPIYDLATNQFHGCAIFPDKQYVNYLQLPCLLSGKADCFNAPPNSYQWDEYDNGTMSWIPIAGANNVDFAPPAFTQEKWYSRTTYDNFGNQDFNNNGAHVFLNDFSAGTLYTTSTTIPFGQQPEIIDEMPYGGTCLPVDYYIEWQVSYNERPWEVFATRNIHFPGLPNGITKNSVRIRRMVKCGMRSDPLYTNILEFGFQEFDNPNVEARNYIKENVIMTKGIESIEESWMMSASQKLQTTTYFDGISRPNQIVDREVGTPSLQNPTVWQDVVTPIRYDEASRSVHGYLPYATINQLGLYKTDVYTDQSQYYQTNFNDPPAYTQTLYEASPLNLVENSKSAGAAWANSLGESYDYDVSDLSDDVKIWNIGYAPGDLPVWVGQYPTGELLKTITYDENLNKVVEFTDKAGHVILRKVQMVPNPPGTYFGWSCTYNVYDDLGQLRFSITPKAVEYLDINGWTLTTTIANELCYSYEYDERGRTVIKNTPQSGQVKMIYDKRNRPVLLQNANQDQGYYSSGTKQWSFTLYDELDRPAVTGIFNNAQTRDNLQLAVDGLPMTNSQVSVNLGGAGSENVTVYNSVASLGSSVQYNSINYYDNYSYPGSKSFSFSFGIPPSSDPNVDPIASSLRTYGLETGSKLRTLDNSGRVLVATTFYDEMARVIQLQGDNVKAGNDIVTSQFDFTDKVMYSSTIHNAPGTAYSNYEILTRFSFDRVGRVTLVSKQFGNSGYKDIAEYTYDDFGRSKQKRLGLNPISGGSQVESLDYSYNINGQLTGINKFYALKDPVLYNKWNNFFGLYLDYDNKDGSFGKSELNGNINGTIWTTQGDDAQRRFIYYYDAANQLKNAFFTQKDNPGSGWTNTKFDFSVSGMYGQIEYDVNGNIQRMQQKGVIPGMGPQTVDDLQYSYANLGYSNKLTKVEDLTNLSAGNNGLNNDFKDGTNGTSPDYDYDLNGNLVFDENKKIKNLSGVNGIKYNYMDKIEELKIDGKGTIKFVYDAAGNKLQRIFTPLSGPAKTMSYIGEFVYDGDDLQYINFEEGRVRVITPINLPYKSLQGNFVLPGTNKQGVFDYFITDNLGNTRMILTEELQSAMGLCTMEQNVATIEEQQFGQVDANGNPTPSNELQLTRTPTPGPWLANGNPTAWSCGLVDQTGKRVGPNVILKVMAGDLISSEAKYYFPITGSPPAVSQLLTDIVSSLVGAINSGNVSGIVKGGNSSGINTNLTNSDLSAYVSTMPGYGNSNAPRAYLNIIYLDEQFNYVGAAIPQRVDISGPGIHYVQQPADRAPKNGYAFIFLSNESNQMVYFDEFNVTHTRGRIAEENHYYPYGLKIAGISSRKLGDPENGHLQNRFGYQGAFSELDDDIGWNEFDLRMYDPQIGRWVNADPYDEFPSPYLGMGNNPANAVDPSGGWLFDSPGAIAGITSGLVVGAIWAASTSKNGADAFAKVAGSMILGGLIGSLAGNIDFAHLLGSFSQSAFRYGVLNISDLQAHNPTLAQQLLHQLQVITGLLLDVDAAGNVGYRVHRRIFGSYRRSVARFRHSSQYARQMLISIIENGNPILVHDFANPQIGSHVPFTGDVNINLWQGNDQIEGHGVDPLTFRIGMVFLHEYGHTANGGGPIFGGWRDLAGGVDVAAKWGGINERARKINKIRRQLSRLWEQSWGQRRAYFATPDGGAVDAAGNYHGWIVIPFNKAAVKEINRQWRPGMPIIHLRFSWKAKYVRVFIP